MNYTASHAYEQLEFDFSASSYLLIPSALPGFHNADTKRYNSINGSVVYTMKGTQDTLPVDAVCASCSAAMHVHNNREITKSEGLSLSLSTCHPLHSQAVRSPQPSSF